MSEARAQLDFEQRLRQDARHVDEHLRQWWESQDSGSGQLYRAVGYSLLDGGKRLRAVLCLWAAEAAGGGDMRAAWRAAAALEMVHCYSLIHDDLPAMDDDDLRRGKPSCHREFDEATAILAGDVLQAEAFAELVRVEDPAMARDLVHILSGAAGLAGMVGGQQLDLESGEDSGPLNWERIERLHRWKTGRLLGAALALGARAGGITGEELAAAQAAGESAGLAFQIVDDILDETGDSEALGKSVGKDRAQGKATALRALGSVEAARNKAIEYMEESLAGVEAAGIASAEVCSLLRHLVEREA